MDKNPTTKHTVEQNAHSHGQPARDVQTALQPSSTHIHIQNVLICSLAYIQLCVRFLTRSFPHRNCFVLREHYGHQRTVYSHHTHIHTATSIPERTADKQDAHTRALSSAPHISCVLFQSACWQILWIVVRNACARVFLSFVCCACVTHIEEALLIHEAANDNFHTSISHRALSFSLSVIRPSTSVCMPFVSGSYRLSVYMRALLTVAAAHGNIRMCGVHVCARPRARNVCINIHTYISIERNVWECVDCRTKQIEISRYSAKLGIRRRLVQLGRGCCQCV